MGPSLDLWYCLSGFICCCVGIRLEGVVGLTAALRRHDSRDKRIERLEAECEKLRGELEKKQEATRFLPPESFLSTYSLLHEIAYLSRGPQPEVKGSYQKPGEVRLPIRDFRAHRMKTNIDKQLKRLKYQMVQYLERGEPIPDPDQKGPKGQGKIGSP